MRNVVNVCRRRPVADLRQHGNYSVNVWVHVNAAPAAME